MPSRDCTPRALPRAQGATSAVGLLAMTNLGAIAFLILARTSRRCSAGSGCPLPYNTACGRRWLVRAATASPRLPRRFAPRNDTSGSAAVHQCPPAVEWLCTRRSVTALQAVGFAARIRWRKVNKFVIARPQRGRGALSAKREEVPLGCNLGKAVAISPMNFLLSGHVPRDCHVASLLAMTNLIALRHRGNAAHIASLHGAH